MERKIIFKNTATEQELVLPVTPSRYPVTSGRAVERLDMAQTGQLALPGLATLMQENLEIMLPAQMYPFCTAEAVADPEYYKSLFEQWSMDRNVCRYIVAGTGINIPVLIGAVTYEERDGTNDVYASIPLYEYRYLDEVTVETTQNNSRKQEGTQANKPDTYTVVAGDSLWSIAKRFYGDGSYATKLAAANNISNPSLIYPGQVLTLPGVDVLSALGAKEKTTTSSGQTTGAARSITRIAFGMNEGTPRTMV